MLCCRKQDTDNPDLTVQLDVFEQWKTNDDEQLTAPDGVDLNDHLNVFHAVFKQVSHVTLSVPYVTLLLYQRRLRRLQARRFYVRIMRRVNTNVAAPKCLWNNSLSGVCVAWHAPAADHTHTHVHVVPSP